jgi:hypothetical protein
MKMLFRFKKIGLFDAELFSLSESIGRSKIFISFPIDKRRIPLQLGPEMPDWVNGHGFSWVGSGLGG